eukprot:10485232-Karenia_brevis.AAC.1
MAAAAGSTGYQQVQPPPTTPGPKAWRDEPAYHRGPKAKGPPATLYQAQMAIPVPKQAEPKQPSF